MIISQKIQFSKLKSLSDYPNPIFAREQICYLDGEWSFGEGFLKNDNDFKQVIRVPFPIESTLSRVKIDNKMSHDISYAKDLIFDRKQIVNSIILHFGAVDYFTEVFINGTLVKSHKGGYTPFEVDISSFLHVGKNRILVLVHDDILENIPSGKQTKKEGSWGCYYTRVSGIWQSVWIEMAPKKHLESIVFEPDFDTGKLTFIANANSIDMIEMEITYKNKLQAKFRRKLRGKGPLTISLKNKYLWSIGKGNLYRVKITFGKDVVYSYFAIRKVYYKDLKFYLNDEPLFQKLIMDQGYYGDGIYAPQKAIDEFTRDLELVTKLGFNGVRAHQKIFDPRYLYLADKYGLLVWEEYPSWGIDVADYNIHQEYLEQWKEAIKRDINHPSIITWVPFNETWESSYQHGKTRSMDLIEEIYNHTKTLDPTRPCIDVSGGHHGHFTDVFDAHCFLNHKKLAKVISILDSKDKLKVKYLYSKKKEHEDVSYTKGLPVVISEFGGLSIKGKGGWGYHCISTEEQFIDEYAKLVGVIKASSKISGFCYVQLYDVEQEKNGLFDEKRNKKFSDKCYQKIKEINQSK